MGNDAKAIEFEDIFELLLEVYRRRPCLKGPVVPCVQDSRRAFLLFDGETVVDLYISTYNYRKSLLKHRKSGDYRHRAQAAAVFHEFSRGGDPLKFVNGVELDVMFKRLTNPLPPTSWERLLEG